MLSTLIVLDYMDMFKSGEYCTNYIFLINMNIKLPDLSDRRNRKNTRPMINK